MTETIPNLTDVPEQITTNPALTDFVNESLNLFMSFFGLINAIGAWGISLINLLLGVIGFKIPANIDLLVFNLNTSAFFNTAITILVVVLIWKRGGDLIKDYSKWLIILTVIIIALSVVSAVITG